MIRVIYRALAVLECFDLKNSAWMAPPGRI